MDWTRSVSSSAVGGSNFLVDERNEILIGGNIIGWQEDGAGQ